MAALTRDDVRDALLNIRYIKYEIPRFRFKESWKTFWKIERMRKCAAFGSLDAKLLTSIFRCLDPVDLCQCAGVNIHWRKVATSHTLWNRLCVLENVSNEEGGTCSCEENNGDAPCPLIPHVLWWCKIKRNHLYNRFRVRRVGLSQQDCEGPKHSDGERMIVCGDGIKIWDIGAAPTLLFQVDEIVTVGDVIIYGDLVFMFHYELKKVDPRSPCYFTVFHCVLGLPVSYDFAFVSEEIDLPPEGRLHLIPLYTLSVFSSSWATFEVDARLSRVWFVGRGWVALRDEERTCTLRFREARSGRALFAENFGEGLEIIGGVVEESLLYVVLCNAHNKSINSLKAIDVERQLVKFSNPLKNLQYIRRWFSIDIWGLQYVLICSRNIILISKKDGSTLTVMNWTWDKGKFVTEVPMNDLPRSCHSVVHCLSLVDRHTGSGVMGAIAARMIYLVNPFGFILSCHWNKFHMCVCLDNKLVCRVKFFPFCIDHKGNLDQDFRAATLHYSKTCLVVVFPDKLAAYVFDFAIAGVTQNVKMFEYEWLTGYPVINIGNVA